MAMLNIAISTIFKNKFNHRNSIVQLWTDPVGRAMEKQTGVAPGGESRYLSAGRWGSTTDSDGPVLPHFQLVSYNSIRLNIKR